MSRILILSGGGAKGAFQAGVYSRFMEEGWKPDAVAGISVGALNAAMIATAQEHKILNLWDTISPEKVLKKNGIVKSGTRTAKNFLTNKLGLDHLKLPFLQQSEPPLGYYSNKPLRNLLRANIGSRFIMDYYCGSVNMNNLTYHTHHARPLMVPWTYIDKILASTAIPLVFNPVRIGDDLHVDGGVRHMSPLKAILRDQDPTEIRIVLCNKYRGYQPSDLGPVRNVIDLSKRTLDTLLNEIFMKDLREFERINRLVKQAHDEGWELKKSNGRPYQNYKTKLYEPKESLGDSLNFNADQAVRNIVHGREVIPIEL